jgi:adhesin HecA-like repeat protein
MALTREEPVMRHVLVLAFCTVVTTMTFAQSSKQVFPNANASLPFSTAIKADGLVYVSGTLGSGGDVKAQTKQVLDNHQRRPQDGRLEISRMPPA